MDSDVRTASRRGVRSHLFAYQQPTRYERLFYETPGFSTIVRSAVAGCSRSVRLRRHFGDEAQQVIWDTAANVAGPLLSSYVLWLLLAAREKGIDRLYFLARDGQILLRIAEKLVTWLNLSIDVRYLYASRQSLFVPAITSIDDNLRSWFGDRLPGITLRQALARLELCPETIADALVRNGFDRSAWDSTLCSSDREAVLALLHDRDVEPLVLTIAAKRRAHLLQYLRQEGFADGKKLAIVDLG